MTKATLIRRSLTLAALLATLPPALAEDRGMPGPATPDAARRMLESAARSDLPPLLPLPPAAAAQFEENRGQYPDYIAYVWNGDTLVLRDGSNVVLSDITETAKAGVLEARFLRTELSGAQPSKPVGRDPVAGLVNYLRPRPVIGVRRFREVLFAEVYPAIDLVYKDRAGSLKYDLVVRPGGDPSVIRMRLAGAETARIDERGDLVIRTAGRQVVHERPRVFQQDADGRRQVKAGYRLLRGGSFGFALEDWDRERELVIDPQIVYSTYLGGSQTLRDEVCTLSGNENDIGHSIAVDSERRAIVAGRTCSVDFPTANPFQGDLASVTFESQTDGFVARFAADGATLDFATYLGGSDFDSANAVATGPGDAITVAGITISEDFPTEDPLFSELSGGVTSASDAFVSVLQPDGQALLFSTFLGGIDEEQAHGVAVGPDGAIAVAGETESDDFPTENPFQTRIDDDDAFVTLITPARDGLAFSTYLGSGADDRAEDVAIDLFNAVVVVGTTLSGPFGDDLFPDVDALKPINENLLSDAFVARFEPDGQPVFITLLGGPQSDEGHAVAVDSQGEIFAAGSTGGELFPEPSESALQTAHGGSSDVFVVKLDLGGQSVLYSTYYGGADQEIVGGVAVDAFGAAVIAGEVNGNALPLAQAVQGSFGGDRDVFVAKLTTNADALLFSTYLGGGSTDVARDVAVDDAGDAYLTGFSFSADYPTQQPYQGVLNGTVDAIVTKIGESVVDFRYEYATKVVCGEQPDREVLTLARGAYATTVNVHSPGRERARFRKKLALSIPPGFQQPGAIVPISFDALDYDEALASDCDDLRLRIAQSDPEDRQGLLAADYFEGFLVLQSTDPLDVTAVYSTADLGNGDLASDNASIDVEEVSERDRIRPTDLAITKESYRLPSTFLSDNIEIFYVGYLITLTNLGSVDAYDLIVKDFLTWDGAFFVVPFANTFLVGNGGSLEIDSFLPILLSQGTVEMTGKIPLLEAQGTTWIAFWTAGIRRVPDQAPTTLVDTVFLSSAGEDPNPANNSAVETTDL